MTLKSMILAGFLVSCAAPAAVAASGQIDGSGVNDILNLMRGYGSATLGTQDNGDPKIAGKIEGQPYSMYFSNCTNNKDCEDIDLYAGYLGIKPSLDKLNAWNRDTRFGRAYLDNDGDAGIDMDINLVHGVSADNLDSTLSIWAQLVKKYTAYVGAK